ncbi:hypothetical protein J6590_031089 [Homalodisca vitripennis]|nr:hypothetical protein J6590_031089 [Homalodisca vitripennis]
MSGKRRAGGPVRQLSLQQSQRRQLRKQASEESPRARYWGDHGLRVLASSLVSQEPPLPRREAQPVVVRPRPVRIAWTERRQVSCEGDVPVGVVVQRCKGLPRPVTAKPAKTAAPPDTILYSRQQLAERLRIAWRDRQERPNLDIFLAHNSVDKGDEDAVLSVREIVTQVENNSLNCNEDLKNSNFNPLSDIVNTNFTKDFRQLEDDPRERPRFKVSSVQTFPTATFPLAAFREPDSDVDTVTQPVRPKLTPSITISFDHADDSEPAPNDNEADDEVPCPENTTSEHLLKPESYSRIDLGDERSQEGELEGKKNDKVKEPDKPKQDNLTATMRRANFRNSSNNPVMSGSLSVSSTPPATPSPQATKPILKKSLIQPLTRMMSAPAAGRSAPTRGRLVKDNNFKAETTDLDYDEDDIVTVQKERNIKSAPARRKFTGGRRKVSKSHEDDSSEEENYGEPLPAPAKPRNRKRFIERGADIVTMVSLLSPNESEGEDLPEPVVQLPQESPWSRSHGTQQEDTKSNPASSAATTVTITTPATTPAIVCLRKFPAKTGNYKREVLGACLPGNYNLHQQLVSTSANNNFRSLDRLLSCDQLHRKLKCIAGRQHVIKLHVVNSPHEPFTGSAARDPHGIKQITVGPPHGIKQITMFIRENVECLDSSFTTTTTIKVNNCTLIFHYR